MHCYELKVYCERFGVERHIDVGQWSSLPGWGHVRWQHVTHDEVMFHTWIKVKPRLKCLFWCVVFVCINEKL